MTAYYSEPKVKDKQSFSRFVGLLLEDFNKNPESWENNRLDLFLEAIQAYTDDLDGFYKNIHPDRDAEEPTWQAFADILNGAVVYE